MLELTVPACVIFKHANPCGVAVAGSIEEAYEKALASDPTLGVRRSRRPQPAGRGRARRGDRRAVRRAAARAGLRRAGARKRFAASRTPESSSTTSAGASMPASATSGVCSAACSSRIATGASRSATAWRSSVGDPTEADWGDLLFAWRVCKHVTSNAIVLVEGPADRRDRRGPDEPSGLRQDRGRQGARSTVTNSRAPRLRQMPSSRSPTARGSRSRRGSRRSSSRAARSATRT